MAILIDFHWIMKFMATLGCNVDDSNLDGNEQQTSSKKRKSKASSSATKKKRLKNGMIEGNDKTPNTFVLTFLMNVVHCNPHTVTNVVKTHPLLTTVINQKTDKSSREH